MTKREPLTLACYKGSRLTTSIICFYVALAVSSYVYAEHAKIQKKQIVVSTDGHNCPIQIDDPYGARIGPTRYVLDHFPYPRNGVRELYLEFDCLSSDDEEGIKTMIPASFNQAKMKWEEDFSALSIEDRKALKPVTQMFSIRAANSDGAGVTQEQTNGDDETRDRRFAFCLRRPPVALCGGTSQIARPYYKNSDLLPFALRVVRSIEFVDMPLSTPAGAGTTATSKQ